MKQKRSPWLQQTIAAGAGRILWAGVMATVLLMSPATISGPLDDLGAAVGQGRGNEPGGRDRGDDESGRGNGPADDRGSRGGNGNSDDSGGPSGGRSGDDSDRDQGGNGSSDDDHGSQGGNGNSDDDRGSRGGNGDSDDDRGGASGGRSGDDGDRDQGESDPGGSLGDDIRDSIGESLGGALGRDRDDRGRGGPDRSGSDGKGAGDGDGRGREDGGRGRGNGGPGGGLGGALDDLDDLGDRLGGQLDGDERPGGSRGPGRGVGGVPTGGLLSGPDSGEDGHRTGPHRYNELINSLRTIEPASVPAPRDRAPDRQQDDRSAFSERLGEVAAELDDAATEALLQSGWETPVAAEDRFSSHAERVRTMVDIARELGVDPRVGVMQANFGTPQENELIDPLRELEKLEATGRGETAEAAALRETIERKAAAVNPDGGATIEGWEIVDLDVDGNGVVDTRDLQRARAGEQR